MPAFSCRHAAMLSTGNETFLLQKLIACTYSPVASYMTVHILHPVTNECINLIDHGFDKKQIFEFWVFSTMWNREEISHCIFLLWENKYAKVVEKYLRLSPKKNPWD